MFSWEIDELADCIADERYFIETHFRAINPFHGISTLNLVGKQAHMLDRIRGKQCILDRVEERQVGVSTVLAAHAFWIALFHPHQRIVIMGRRYIDSQEHRRMIQLGHEQLPDFLQAKILTDHKESMEFSNGSWIHFINSDADHLRGIATSCIIADTFEYFGHHQQAKLRYHINTFKLDTEELLVI